MLTNNREVSSHDGISYRRYASDLEDRLCPPQTTSISIYDDRTRRAGDGVSFQDGLTLTLHCLLFFHHNIMNVGVRDLHGEVATGKP